MNIKNIFKYLIIFTAIVFSINYSFADSCIMVSPAEITKIDCTNNNIVEFHILSTLMNEKKSIIVTPVSDGEINFVIRLKNKKCDYKATVRDGKLEISGDKYIKILPIDLPPELSGEVNAK